MIIPFHKPYITEDEVTAAAECIRNGWLTMGKITIDFEEKFREYIGVPYAVSVNSCTAALHLALCATGLNRGDEVIIPTTTFAATAEVVRYFDALPVAVDIDRETHCIDVSKIEQAITSRTKAIIPVHYGGQPCDMDEILQIAKKYNLKVIEDAAHSLPAYYRNRAVGTLGDITCFSFYATKTLAVGEGGMITTANTEWVDMMRMLRLHGVTRDAWKRYTKEGSWQYDVQYAGFKYNATDIASAIGVEQLKKCDAMRAMRAAIAKKYNEAFSSLDELILYTIKPDRTSAWHLYPIKLNLAALTIDRNVFIDQLKERGVLTSVHFIPLYRFSYYSNYLAKSDFYPESEWVFEREISLPLYPGMTEAESDYVIEQVSDLCKKYRKGK
jgi:dTDP-4-amino-4,6-dideoxygalactose transaminase